MIIYTACLALGLLFAIISAFAGHLFGGHDGGDVGTGGHAEGGYDHSGVPGISFFSPTVLACFVTAFGACGLILTHSRKHSQRLDQRADLCGRRGDHGVPRVALVQLDVQQNAKLERISRVVT